MKSTPETKPTGIANLPACGRRSIAVNQDGLQIYCKPPKRPPGLTDAEAVADPDKWFAKHLVSHETCMNCTMCGDAKPVRVDTKQPVYMDAGLFPDLAKRSQAIRDVSQSSRTSKPEILDDGTIVYEKIGWEPPPTPVGYRRKSDDLSSPDAWVMVRTTPLCKHLKLVQIEKPTCRCTRVQPVCTLRRKLSNIKPNQCETCLDRK